MAPISQLPGHLHQSISLRIVRKTLHAGTSEEKKGKAEKKKNGLAPRSCIPHQESIPYPMRSQIVQKPEV